MQRLSGKTAIISGASRGIGAETARVFVDAGAKVALLARSEAAIADLAAELGPAAVAIPCDVSRYWEVAAAVDATQSAFGAVDVLINNAGVIEPISHMHRAAPDAWSHVIAINLKGVFYAVRAVLPTMGPGHGPGARNSRHSDAAGDQGLRHQPREPAGLVRAYSRRLARQSPALDDGACSGPVFG